MPALTALAMFFQDTGAMASDVHLLMIAEWIIAIFCIFLCLCVLVGAIVALVMISKIKKQVAAAARTVEVRAQPFITKGQEIMGHTNQILADLKPKIAKVTSDLEPKIASVSSDVAHISSVVRSTVDELGQTVSQVNSTMQDVNAKSKAQVARVNTMVSDALTTTEHVSRSIQHGIRVPIQKIAGWVAAVKAGAETLAERMPWAHRAAGSRPSAPGASGTGSPGPGTTASYRSPASSSGGAGLSTPAGPHIVKPTTTGTPGGGAVPGSGGVSSSGGGLSGGGSVTGLGSAAAGTGSPASTGPAGSGTASPATGTSGTGAGGAGFTGSQPYGPGASAPGKSTPASSGSVRETGTAAPGGPPFVPAPDKPKPKF